MSTGSITVNLSVSVSNNGYTYNWMPQTTNTQAAQGAVAAVKSMATSVTDVDISGVTTPGYLFAQNLDPADGNYVDFGHHSGGMFTPLGRLQPGQIAAIPLNPSISLAFQAHTAAVEVMYHVESA